MFELNQIGEKSYYISNPTNIGIYKQNETDVYLIDSGNDKNTAKKIKKILDENNWNLKGIINTHSHADHIGGNRYLQQQTDCKIFTNGIETAFTESPILEPSFLYGGCPGKDLKHKFLFAPESQAIDICSYDFPKELEIIPLKGHSFDMIGIRTPDNIIFLADCISSKNTLEKYKITFIYDVEQYLKTLDNVETLKADMFIPSHCEATSNIGELVHFNRQKVFEISEKILYILKTPMCFEELLKHIFDEYNLTMNFEQHVLVGSTVRSYLTWLKENQKIDFEFKNNILNWKSL